MELLRSGLRSASVSRAGIIEKSRVASIVAVTAPAGYGKSTLLGQWAELEQRRTVSLTLSPFDNDPSALLSAIATAFTMAMPDFDGFLTVSEQPAVGTAVLGQMAPRLAAAISNVDDPFVLMIDDVHEASSARCQDVLEVALARIPPGSQVVLASRHALPFLARLRPTGEVLQVGSVDLQPVGAGTSDQDFGFPSGRAFP